jgi:hypothetical protein
MTHLLTTLFPALVLALGLAGCASSSAGGPDHPHEHGEHGHEHGEGHHEHGEGHHEPVGGGLKSFHDLLAPAYHMDKGPARNDAACSNVPGMKDATGKIAAEPKGDPAAWKTKSDALARSLEALDAACGVAGRAEVQAKFEVVHENFHALMEAAH